MVKILLTGASGYIGGDVLYLLAKAHPEYEITALVRDEAKGRQITSAFPSIKVFQGSLDDTEVLAGEASRADVVLHLASTGHLQSVQTIHKALSGANRPKTHWIQISGASALGAPEISNKSWTYGEGSDQIYEDLDSIEELRTLIRKHPSRAVDNYVLNAASETPQVKTALVFPPIIYGHGRGPINQRSYQVPGLARLTLEGRRGLQVGRGLSRWGNVHIHDVSALFVKLVENAVEGSQDSNRIWGQDGLYLTGVGEMTFGEISRRIAAAAADQGLIPDGNEIGEVDAAKINELMPHGAVLLGTNARSNARRAKELLGWAPTGDSLEAEIPRAVASEAKSIESAQAP